MKNNNSIQRKVKEYACLFLMAISIPCSGQEIPKALILTGNGNLPVVKDNYPPWRHEFQNRMVMDILKGVVAVDTTSNLGMLNSETLGKYDLIISNSMFLTPDNDQLDALYRFVAEGKSFLTIHCGILSFFNWEKYEQVMGGIIIGGPSSEPESFKVFTTNEEFWGYGYPFRNSVEYPVSKVVEDFTIKDELYYFQPGKPDFHVIARAENHPVMWWHPVANGKVMSLTLGHDETAKENLGYQQLLINGVRWLTGIPLIQARDPRPISNRKLSYDDFLELNVFSPTDDSITFEVQNNTFPDLYTIIADSEGRLNIELSGKTGEGKTSISIKNEVGLSSEKDLNIRVVQDGEENIASYMGNTVTVSSSENQSPIFNATNIIDRDLSTRWSSSQVDTVSVVIDLKKAYPVGKIALHWEASYAREYAVRTSKTGSDWNTVVNVKQGDGESDILTFAPGPARYIQVLGTKRAPGKWGYSLHEVEVYRE